MVFKNILLFVKGVGRMVIQQNPVLDVLNEIKELLIPISAHFEAEYIGTKQKQLESILSTDVKKKIYSLLFDTRKLSQSDIAKEANTTQPSVSRLIASLLETKLIAKDKDEAGKEYFIEKFSFATQLETKNGKTPE